MREIRTSDSTRGRLAADSSLLSVLPYPYFRNGAGRQGISAIESAEALKRSSPQAGLCGSGDGGRRRDGSCDARWGLRRQSHLNLFQ